MTTRDFTLTFTTGRSPQDVFNAVMDVRNWWSGLYAESFEGNMDKQGDEFGFRAGNGAHYSRQRLEEVVPGRRLVWLVTESHFSFVEKADEWTGTRIIFDIVPEGDRTRLTFTHQGLSPQIECYDACAPAWTQYLQQKLLPLLNTGTAASAPASRTGTP